MKREIKLNGRTYLVEASDDATQGLYMATYYGLRAYGTTGERAAWQCDKMVQESYASEPEDC